jgi:hypothetical protein
VLHVLASPTAEQMAAELGEAGEAEEEAAAVPEAPAQAPDRAPEAAAEESG